MKEEWRYIPGYGILYKVSSLGKVMSEPRMVIYGDHRTYRLECRKLKKQTIHNKKYFKVSLTDENKVTKQFTVHRLMAWAFFGPQEKGIEVRHINGNGFDNRIDNLCYGSKSENMRDAISHRTFSMSDWHPCAKLTKQQVKEIIDSDRFYKDIAKDFGIHPHTVHKIKRKEIRNHD
jgi:hypothetical protein